MTLILDLTLEQEQQIEAQARARNMDIHSYALGRLFEEQEEAEVEEALPPVGPLPPVNGTGADLVAYWEREGLIGTRPDIRDSQTHAREIRISLKGVLAVDNFSPIGACSRRGCFD